VVPALVLAVLTGAPPARAAGEKAEGSLALIPADAAFYSTMLRNKEQIDLLTKSKAWAALHNLPLVKMALQAAHQQWETGGGPWAAVRAIVEQEENQELLALLGDAVSHEVFCYGGANWIPFIELAGLVSNANQFAPLLVLIEKGPDAAGGDVQARAVLRALGAHPELLQVPDFVLGFKLTDAKKALNQIRRLEALGVAVADQHPLTKGRVKSVKVGDDSFLTLNLDGSMVPWDEVPVKQIEEKEGEFDAVVKKLKELKLTVSLGVRGDYLMLGVGSSADVVTQIGGKGKRLIDAPEMKPVAAAAGKRLTSVGYMSAALRAESSTSEKDVENMLAFAQQGLAKANIPEEQRKKLVKDIDALSRELLKDLPQYGAEVQFCYLTDRGYESYGYDHTKNRELDGSRPLTLLHHLGGNPLLAAVMRQKTASPENYRAAIKLIKAIYGDVEEVVLGKLENEQRAIYQKYSKEIFPLLKRLDEITGTMLLPALADGQWGFVLDGQWASKQWHQAMPPLPQALPLPEPALVLGVSDAGLLRKAVQSYRALVNDAIAKARELAPKDQIPDFQVPEPESKEGKGGNLFFYPFPREWGVDAQVVPTAGLSEKVAVLTLSHALAERILEDKPLRVKDGPLADLMKPRASAGYLDWPAMVDTFVPWIEMGVTMSGVERALPPGEGGAQATKEDVLKQVRTVIRVLKVLRTSTSSTSLEDDVWVTHGETVFRDLEE
jgi:hypothetical protein